ncbi:MAG: hypothetical protein IJT18_01475 [Oscillospiraceae bacterium]|nr:hypothetical protein [Oscillospiraceae bacterium]
MTAFTALPLGGRLLLAGALFFAALAQFALCLYRRLSGSTLSRRLPDDILFALLTFAAAYATAAAELNYPLPLPYALIAAVSALIIVRAVLAALRISRESREKLSPASVRQALDDLNTGVCFADGAGRIVLINRAMGGCIAALSGSYPQTLSQLREALSRAQTADEPPLYRLPDGTVRRVQTVNLSDPALAGFTQTTAQNVTALYEANERLREHNAALAETNEKTRQMYDRLADRIREQETLSLKTRIHDDIGSSLIAISELLAGGTGDMETQLAALRSAVSYFSNDLPAEPGTFADAQRQAAEMHAELTLTGALPPDPAAAELVVTAARECVTNCIRHAHGDRVHVAVTTRTGQYTVTVTNSGDVPPGPIREGGGLSMLRRRVEAYGGEMHTAYRPRFALILNLPEKEREV